MSKCPVICMEPIDENNIIINGKGEHIPKATDTNLNTNIREDGRAARSISGYESISVNNLESEINAEKMHNVAHTETNSTDTCNMKEKDYRRMTENPPGQLEIQGTCDAQSGLNIPMVVIPRYTDLHMATAREADESAATNPQIHMNNSVRSSDRVDPMSEEEFKREKHAVVESAGRENPIKEENPLDAEDNAAFAYKEREKITSEIPLESSLVLETIVVPTRNDVIDHNAISPAFLAILENSTNNLNLSKQNLAKLREPGESDGEESTDGISSKNDGKRSVEKRTEMNTRLTEKKEETSSQKTRRIENLERLKRSTTVNRFCNSETSQNSHNHDASLFMPRIRIKLKRISTRNLRPENKDKKTKRLKKHTIKTRTIPLDNYVVPQNSLNSHLLLSMSKVKVRVQRVTKQNFTTKYPNIKWPSNIKD